MKYECDTYIYMIDYMDIDSLKIDVITVVHDLVLILL